MMCFGRKMGIFPHEVSKQQSKTKTFFRWKTTTIALGRHLSTDNQQGLVDVGVDHFLLMGGHTSNSFQPGRAEVLLTVKHMQTEGKLFIRIHKSATMGDLAAEFQAVRSVFATRSCCMSLGAASVVHLTSYAMMGCHQPTLVETQDGANELNLARW